MAAAILATMRGWAPWLGLAMAVALAACGGTEPAPTPAPTVAPTLTPTATPTPTPVPTVAPTAAPTAVASVAATPSPTPTASPTPAPVVMRYGAPDPTGAVDEAGEYAFFAADGSAITTYEGLRQDAARLVIHERDADGQSWAAFYDAVVVGDHFEWREAEDCWVRYFVDDAPPAPAGAPVRVFAVRRYGYAYTGCAGPIAATGDRAWTWAPPGIRSPDVAVPVRHGIWLLLPRNGNELIEERIPLPAPDGEWLASSDPEEVRKHPLWRQPDIPEAWVLRSAMSGNESTGKYGYSAMYHNEHGYYAVSIIIRYAEYAPFVWESPVNVILDLRIVDGNPAVLWYHPLGETSIKWVRIFDQETGVEYIVVGGDVDLQRGGIEETVEIARSLYAPTAVSGAAPSADGESPVVMRDGAPDPTGAVDEAGEYAFFAADGSAITTYEGLRQDAARLVIHERDADGQSWAAFYDAVEAGDHFEWREADDCWVRYFVDEAPPAPAGAPVRVFAVRRYGYAYTGCAGPIAATGDRTWSWAPPGIRSPDVAVPVRHGPWLLTPKGDWGGALEDQVQVRALPRDGADDGTAWHPRPFPEPRVPEGWTGGVGIAPHGYLEGFYSDEEGFALLVTIALRYYLPRYEYTGEGVGPDAYVHEVRVIDGRTMLLKYLAEPGVMTSTLVSIYDDASGIEYITEGYAPHLRNDIEATIKIARTLVPGAP